MLSVASIGSASGYADYLGSDNYYANEDPSEWAGAGAAALGLTDADAAPEMAGTEANTAEQPDGSERATNSANDPESGKGAEKEQDVDGEPVPGGAEGLGETGEATSVGVSEGGGVNAPSGPGNKGPGHSDRQDNPDATVSGQPGVDKQTFEDILNGRLRF